MSALTLTVDELRGLDRWLTDLSLPWFVTAGDVPDLRVDTAALRGLAARDLAVLSPAGAGRPDGPAGDVGADGHAGAEGPRLVLTSPLAQRLAPCRGAALLAEVDVEEDGDVTRYAVLAHPDGPAALLAELPGGLVRLTTVHAAADETVRRLCHLAEPADADTTEDGTGDEHGFGVTALAYAAADDRILAGDRDGAVRTLVSGGASDAAARAWVTAMAVRRRAVALRAAVRPGGTGQVRGGELRWLVAGDGTLWQIGNARAAGARVGEVRNPAPEDDWAGEEPSELVEIAPVEPARLRRAVDVLIAVEIPGTRRKGVD